MFVVPKFPCFLKWGTHIVGLGEGVGISVLDSGTSSWPLNLPKDWWWGSLLLFYNCIWPHFGVELNICKILFKSKEFKGIFVESFFGQQPPIPAAHLAGSSEEESAVCRG